MVSLVRARPSRRKSPFPFIALLPTLFWSGEGSASSRNRRLGFCQQALQGTEASLGAGHSAQVRSTNRREGWDSETHWLAHVSPHILDFAEKRRHRVQGHAGIVATLDLAIHVRCLHAGNHTRETCSSGGRFVFSVLA